MVLLYCNANKPVWHMHTLNDWPHPSCHLAHRSCQLADEGLGPKQKKTARNIKRERLSKKNWNENHKTSTDELYLLKCMKTIIIPVIGFYWGNRNCICPNHLSTIYSLITGPCFLNLINSSAAVVTHLVCRRFMVGRVSSGVDSIVTIIFRVVFVSGENSKSR